MADLTNRHDHLPELHLTSTGDMEQLDLLDEEELSDHSCPVLSFNPEHIRVTTRKQNLFGEQPETLTCNGDSDATASALDSPAKSPPPTQPASPRFITFHRVLLFALMFRLALLLFSIWQDRTRWPDGQLRFTDVDYDVFTDAARALVKGTDIYEARPTYRYSPLIAAVLAPGHWLFGRKVDDLSSTQFFDPPLEDVSETKETSLIEEDQTVARLWGKLIFVLADLLCAWLQYQIIEVESDLHNHDHASQSNNDGTQWATCFILFGWLFNPVTAVVSVRGNAEAVLGVCVLSCLLLLLRQRLVLAGLMFGLCIHLKLYPVIYAPAIYLWLSQPATHLFYGLLPSRRHLTFSVATLVSLTLLTSWGYAWFGGMRFLWQAYLYHFTRVDIKHNFAPHFYPLYLLTGSKWKFDEYRAVSAEDSSRLVDNLVTRLHSTLVGFSNTSDPASLWDRLVLYTMNNVNLWNRLFNMASFLPAVLLIPTHSFKLYRQLGLCWFVVTYVFVTFNKVCTSQYFLWSLVLLPVALASLQLPSTVSPQYAIIQSLLLWFGAQGLWLAAAYSLEMYTQTSEFMAVSVWRLVWLASLVFLGVNTLLIRRFIKWKKPCICIANDHPSYDDYISSHEKKVQ